MKDRMKYIVFDDGLNPESVVIFPSWVNHGEFAAVWSGATVVSAGEIEISKDGGIWCGGRSVTLSVSSRPYQDMILVEKMLFRE